MGIFEDNLKKLIDPLDPTKHAVEIGRLRKCRSYADLERISAEGWLSTHAKDPRLKLVKHGSGTMLVVEYLDGWSTRLSMQDFPRR